LGVAGFKLRIRDIDDAKLLDIRERGGSMSKARRAALPRSSARRPILPPWCRGNSYKFYADGVTPAVARLYEAINAERVAAAAALGACVPTLAG
jgi:hypothetical protein